MSNPCNVLIFGASFGAVLGVRLLQAGHDVVLVCRNAEAEIINRAGLRVRMPIRGRPQAVEIDSRKLPGRLVAAVPEAVDPSRFDLVCLAMTEPQYRADGVRRLLSASARSGVPVLSIMNMPLPPYLHRIRGLDVRSLKPAYSNFELWEMFSGAPLTLCSPDPQALRPPGEGPNVVEVTLATNFKVARFASEQHTEILRRLEETIDASRFDSRGEQIELPVKFRVYESAYVPLAKWAMLVTGNYRCITAGGAIDISDAVNADLAASRSVYEFVNDVCVRWGAEAHDLVSFDKYAAAARSLTRPSSAARALDNGASEIERADKLVQLVATQKNMRHPIVDSVVSIVDERIETNRMRAA